MLTGMAIRTAHDEVRSKHRALALNIGHRARQVFLRHALPNHVELDSQIVKFLGLKVEATPLLTPRTTQSRSSSVRPMSSPTFILAPFWMSSRSVGRQVWAHLRHPSTPLATCFSILFPQLLPRSGSLVPGQTPRSCRFRTDDLQHLLPRLHHSKSASTPAASSSSKGQIHVKLISARSLNISSIMLSSSSKTTSSSAENPTHEDDKEVRGIATNLSRTSSSVAIGALGAVGSKAAAAQEDPLHTRRRPQYQVCRPTRPNRHFLCRERQILEHSQVAYSGVGLPTAPTGNTRHLCTLILI